MNEWLPISSAPKDGTVIQVKIPDHGSDCIVSWEGGLLDTKNRDCGGWHWMTDREPPDCWTDGVCWEVNESGERSIEPTHWMPLPEPPKEAN